MRGWCWPGNTNDMSVIGEVKDGLRGWRLGRVVAVIDRGFSSDENLRYLTRAGGHWIAGERMRDGSPDAAAALARQGRYQTVRDNLRVKEVRIGEGDAAKRFIICHNPVEAERDKTTRTDTIHRLQAERDRIEKQRAKVKSQKAFEAHIRAECALRDHPALGRYLRQTPSGRLRIDRAKIAAEAKLDGKFLLSTSDPHLSAEDVALGYKNLLEAKRGFRDLKTTIELRPIFHRLEHCIARRLAIRRLSTTPHGRLLFDGRGIDRSNSKFAITWEPSPRRCYRTSCSTTSTGSWTVADIGSCATPTMDGSTSTAGGRASGSWRASRNMSSSA